MSGKPPLKEKAAGYDHLRLGNLHKTGTDSNGRAKQAAGKRRFFGLLGTGFVGVHGSLREIPEVVSARKPLRGNGH